MSDLLTALVADTPIPPDPARRAGYHAAFRVLQVYAQEAHHCGSCRGLPDLWLSDRTGRAVSTVRMARGYLERLGLLVIERMAEPLGKGRGSLPVVYRIDLAALRRLWQGTRESLWRDIDKRTGAMTCHPPAPPMARAVPAPTVVRARTDARSKPVVRARTDARSKPVRARTSARTRARTSARPPSKYQYIDKGSPTTETGACGEPIDYAVAREYLAQVIRVIRHPAPKNDHLTRHLNGATVPPG